MEFIEFAKKNKKVKNLYSLNDEFEIEEYSFLLENTTKYNEFCIGDLVFVGRYKYKNGKKGNNHIFLIVDLIKTYNRIIYYGMILSSQIQKITYKSNKLIKKDYINKLQKDSIIKTDVIYKIFTKNILLKIGNIDKTKVEFYKSCLINNT
ncbi:MAG: hypothetical protein IKE01_03055 [Clostridia bacterium]|nr:hypothetical protein [Clostridia bacterium]